MRKEDKSLILSEDIRVLENMEHFVMWAGRYPIPLSPEEQFIRTYSSEEHEKEVVIYERARGYIANKIDLGSV